MSSRSGTRATAGSSRRPRGGARYLVTADREVLLMRGYGAVEFLRAGEFLAALAGHGG